jgi:hypothetical protein
MTTEKPIPQPAQTHTPGPWRVGNGDTRTGYTVVLGDNELLVGGWGLRSLANASLIAAAPELFAACQKFMDGISILNDGPDESDVAHAQNQLVESFKLARAAINKVTGAQA